MTDKLIITLSIEINMNVIIYQYDINSKETFSKI